MAARRRKELAAIALIGDWAVGRAVPRKRWRGPDLVRVLTSAEGPGGLWPALGQYPEEQG